MAHYLKVYFLSTSPEWIKLYLLLQEPGDNDSPYTTRQSFGKAVKRVKTTLPKSDTQAKEVVRHLAKEYA